jgi:hypothetical protein
VRAEPLLAKWLDRAPLREHEAPGPLRHEPSETQRGRRASESVWPGPALVDQVGLDPERATLELSSFVGSSAMLREAT